MAQLEGGHWSPSSQAAFVQSVHPQQVLCVYVHGNRMSASDAVEQGMEMYQQLACTQTPLRFVIWSWPSDRIHGPIQDAQVKAARSEGESYYLASLLARLPSGQSVSLVGYSYGGARSRAACTFWQAAPVAAMRCLRQMVTHSCVRMRCSWVRLFRTDGSRPKAPMVWH